MNTKWSKTSQMNSFMQKCKKIMKIRDIITPYYEFYSASYHNTVAFNAPKTFYAKHVTTLFDQLAQTKPRSYKNPQVPFSIFANLN
jgi:negative regulator of replication initiation